MLLLTLTVIATTVCFWRIDRPAGLLLLPYLAWLVFATLLVVYIWRLN
jgi:tryptophan-rich sensory protein